MPFPASGGGAYMRFTPKIIRFQRHGCTNRPFFHIVVMEVSNLFRDLLFQACLLCSIKGGGGPSNRTVIVLTMMLKVILGLHVSILLNHLQALVSQIHTKNALRIVGSPTRTIKNKIAKL